MIYCKPSHVNIVDQEPGYGCKYFRIYLTNYQDILEEIS